MAGAFNGPNPQVDRYLFVSTYLRALEAGEPRWAALRELGLTDRQIEKRRTKLARAGWMPYGQLTREDVPRVRELLGAKMRQVSRYSQLIEEARERRVQREHLTALRQERRRLTRRHEAVAAEERSRDERSAVLDLFFD